MTFVHSEIVRFNDCDPMGHVNNAIFSTYLEQARLAWFGSDEKMPLTDVILARTEIDFRSPVTVGENVTTTVQVAVAASVAPQVPPEPGYAPPLKE